MSEREDTIFTVLVALIFIDYNIWLSGCYLPKYLHSFKPQNTALQKARIILEELSLTREDIGVLSHECAALLNNRKMRTLFLKVCRLKSLIGLETVEDIARVIADSLTCNDVTNCLCVMTKHERLLDFIQDFFLELQF